ncbi:MAG: DUF2452 domain-containing protein [Crocinitomicaceae bacterium]
MKSTNENPIDKDKTSENPHSLEYGHHVGSAVIKPEDRGKIKGRSLTAMAHQTDQQLSQIYEQMQLLAQQAQKIETRKIISEKIYKSEIRFKPIINYTYYLYQKEDHSTVLSILSPKDWLNSKANTSSLYLATIKLLADHTWDVLDSSSENII